MTTTIEPQVATDNRDLATGDLQRMLLPPSPSTANGWSAVHHFEPAGVVSGDYIDLVSQGDRLYFMVGDVSGKGVAASMLKAQLHAMFRTLIPFQLTLDDLMSRASVLLCASSLPAEYATLICGYLATDGEVVVSNAGHPPPLVIGGTGQAEGRATGVPIGLFCESKYSSTRVSLSLGDTLLVYTDGLSEARNTAGEEYGRRLEVAEARAAHLPLPDLLHASIAEQAALRGECANTDDLHKLSACLKPLIGSLGAADPEALKLVESEGVTQVEAAQRLGLSVSGMQSRVQRARLHLRTALDECCQIALDRRGGVISYEARTEQCGTCQGSSEAAGSASSPSPTPVARPR